MPISEKGKRLRFERAEELRQLLNGEEYLKQLDQCAAGIKEIAEAIKTKETVTQKRESAAKKKERRLTESHELSKFNTKLKAYSTLADLNFKRLAKLIPDLRTTELSDGNDDGDLFGNFAKAVLDFENVVKSTKSRSKKK